MPHNGMRSGIVGLRAALVMAVACLLGTVLPARAAAIAAPSVTWNFDNIVFADGGTANGFVTVVYSDDGKYVSDWHISVIGITTEPGNIVLGPITYDPENSSISLTGDPLFDVLQSDPSELQWSVAALPITGGFQSITSGFFEEGDPYTTDIVSGGIETTPEPPVWILLGTGLLLLAGSAYRRRGTLPA